MNQTSTSAPSPALFVQMAVSAWVSHNGRAIKLFNELSDDELMAETAPGRNRGIYLLGHLIAVSDGMLPLLGFGEKLYPDLTDTFITRPDRAVQELPTLASLKMSWKKVYERLAQHIDSLPAEEWFTRHTAVNAEDFVKEPHRNKLNVLISRTNHLGYHLGQLAYLKKKQLAEI